MSNAKPAHLSGEYGAWFKDPRLAAAYPARPPYPEGVIWRLRELIQDSSGAVLHVGCGTGELARRLSPSAWRPTIDEYLECRHSQRGLSRTHMGSAAIASFDAEVAQALQELTDAGIIVEHEGRLGLGVVSSVTWGRPRARRSAMT